MKKCVNHLRKNTKKTTQNHSMHWTDRFKGIFQDYCIKFSRRHAFPPQSLHASCSVCSRSFTLHFLISHMGNLASSQCLPSSAGLIPASQGCVHSVVPIKISVPACTFAFKQLHWIRQNGKITPKRLPPWTTFTQTFFWHQKLNSCFIKKGIDWKNS